MELPAVERYLNGLNKEYLPNAIRAVHTDTVSEALGTYTGIIRVTFAQIRSEFSKFLNSYLARVNPDISELCPLCCSWPHTTRHLFKCPQRPTSHTPLSLWTDPVEAVRLLNLDLVE